jgi:hypothetical protein
MPRGAVASVLVKAGKKKTIFLERAVFGIIRPYSSSARTIPHWCMAVTNVPTGGWRQNSLAGPDSLEATIIVP